MITKYISKVQCENENCKHIWELDTTNISDGGMYEAICPKCGTKLIKKNSRAEARVVNFPDPQPKPANNPPMQQQVPPRTQSVPQNNPAPQSNPVPQNNPAPQINTPQQNANVNIGNGIFPLQFCVVARYASGGTNSVVCNDFLEACATQLGLLVGTTPTEAQDLLEEQDVDAIAENLAKNGRDRLSNKKDEAYIFLIPEQNPASAE